MKCKKCEMYHILLDCISVPPDPGRIKDYSPRVESGKEGHHNRKEEMRNPAFHKLLEEIKTLHDKKNADYGADNDPLKNLKGCIRMGDHPTKGIAIRLQDKMSRIENYYKNGSLANESVRDSFMDLAIYGLLAIVILDEGENS